MSRDNSQRGVRRTQKIPLSEAEISGPTGRRGGGGGRTEQQLFVKKDRKEVGNDLKMRSPKEIIIIKQTGIYYQDGKRRDAV
jgi:hypothetical protein